LNIIVREAFEYSVTKDLRPVRFQISQVSTVPASSSPRSARSWAPGTASRMKRIFDAV